LSASKAVKQKVPLNRGGSANDFSKPEETE
jgi:hypothetical protein